LVAVVIHYRGVVVQVFENSVARLVLVHSGNVDIVVNGDFFDRADAVVAAESDDVEFDFLSSLFLQFFSPARSNLTLTGQLLDAVDSDYDSEAGTVTVFVKATSRTGAEPDEPQTNAELAVKVAEEGRPFLGLDLIGRARIRRIVIAELRRQLKRR
jgi:hypothetical protein